MAVARTESPGLSRFILPIAGLIGLGLCGAGILVLLDPQGGPNLLASIYDALGNGSGAIDLRNGSGDQVVAKLLLAVIALAVGVGGIWLLFLGVGSLVSLLQPKWRDRILPWVFVGPALRAWRARYWSLMHGNSVMRSSICASSTAPVFMFRRHCER